MKIVPEPDRLDARVPLGILGVSIVTLALGAVLTLAVRSFSESELHAAVSRGARPLAAPVPAAEPSGLFGRHTAAAPTRQRPQRLREYGWVDREQGLVRIPIERAKQLYLAREAALSQQKEGSP